MFSVDGGRALPRGLSGWPTTIRMAGQSSCRRAVGVACKAGNGCVLAASGERRPNMSNVLRFDFVVVGALSCIASDMLRTQRMLAHYTSMPGLR